ncbi:hypothetical protein BJP05_00460 [Corynebacterium sp. NML98-0116]|uniref:ATP-dependent nuclease n=1 Tax=Corynebacterium TaxID=1716 RepID=UPI0008780AC3|nr:MULTISPECIES: ATP-binding protein [Corynebacterium]AOX04820.1 hypothetical protein BJP05_00460 [Corynebacterium sp. NML98-0116]MCQ4608787.1 ATP-binding protein [Corynebacterium pseudogenitalium]UUA87185.1 ATP-binding protein [Corynebacterium pseudogenitalium]
MLDYSEPKLLNAPYIDEIRLASGEALEFKPGEVVLLVGPNNAGKSYFLKALEFQLAGKADVLDQNHYADSIVEKIKINWKYQGEDGVAQLIKQLKKYRSGSDRYFRVPVRGRPTQSQSFLTEGDVYSAFESESKLSELTNVFVSFDDVKDRLDETEPQEQNSAYWGKTLVQQAWDEPPVFNRIASAFRRIFNEDLSFYNLGEGKIGLLLAPPFNKASSLMEPIDTKTRAYMETRPKLWEQGYGMRSVVGLLLRIHASDSSIALLDEPEAFLHPPQASALGSILSELTKFHNRQIFIATHDRNLIASLIRSTETPLTILSLRRDRGNRLPVIKKLNSEIIRSAQQASQVRFTPFLDSLFADLTILVENERDAVFYDEALRAFAEANTDSDVRNLPDRVLFLGAGGASGIPPLAKSLREVGAKVAIITDFDVHAQRAVYSMVSALHSAEAITNVRPTIEKVRVASVKLFGSKNAAKNCGAVSPDKEFNELAQEMLNALDGFGVHLVREGELEDLFPSIEGQKSKPEKLKEALQSEAYRRPAAQQLMSRLVSHVFNQEI